MKALLSRASDWILEKQSDECEFPRTRLIALVASLVLLIGIAIKLYIDGTPWH